MSDNEGGQSTTATLNEPAHARILAMVGLRQKLPGSRNNTARRLTRTEGDPTGLRWSIFLYPPLLIAFLLLALPQAIFVWMGFHQNLGMGRISSFLTLDNYRQVLTDVFYLRWLWVTVYISLGATVLAVAFAAPTAYLLARLRSRIASYFIVLLLTSSFVTVVIKVLGLSLILGQEGIVNHGLMWLGVISHPIQLVNNQVGVLIGLVQYTLPLLVMLLFSVMQTIPSSLEDAAEIHGATWASTLARVVLPLAKPGLVAAALIAFNMNMGAFTSAVLLGGGRVLTLPVLIQQKIILDVDYPLASTLSTVLLLLVFLLNLGFAMLLGRRARSKRTVRV